MTISRNSGPQGMAEDIQHLAIYDNGTRQKHTKKSHDYIKCKTFFPPLYLFLKHTSRCLRYSSHGWTYRKSALCNTSSVIPLYFNAKPETCQDLLGRQTISEKPSPRQLHPPHRATRSGASPHAGLREPAVLGAPFPPHATDEPGSGSAASWELHYTRTKPCWQQQALPSPFPPARRAAGCAPGRRPEGS